MNFYYRLGSNLYVNVTNLCPCDCVFCIRHNTDGVGTAESLWLAHEPTLEELKEAFDQSISRDFEPINEIVFCGFGEPLERAYVVCELAEYIKSGHNHPIRLNTNGLARLINPDFDIKKLSVFDLVSVSLNADTKEEYLRVTRPRFGIESFDSMLGFARDAKNHSKVQFTIVETLDGERQKKCRQIADEMGIPLIVRRMM